MRLCLKQTKNRCFFFATKNTEKKLSNKKNFRAKSRTKMSTKFNIFYIPTHPTHHMSLIPNIFSLNHKIFCFIFFCNRKILCRMIYARLTKSTSSHQKSLKWRWDEKKTIFLVISFVIKIWNSEIMDLSVFRHITIMRIK